VGSRRSTANTTFARDISEEAIVNITGIWEGTLDGTNWGRLLVKLSEHQAQISGHAEITDVGAGIFLLSVEGRRDARSKMVKMHLSPDRSGVRQYPLGGAPWVKVR
jgi:hypothetical protein